MPAFPREQLNEPAQEHRPVPFWSWNDALEPGELRAQVREMHRAGLGGFFMHARGGLRTPYLSDEWMECVKASLDEASKTGLHAWLYDENGWPSGFGNGQVNALGEEYQQKVLCMETGMPDECRAPHTIAWYAMDGTFLGTGLPDGYSGKVRHFFYEVNPYYVDNLDSKVVAAFLESTHERYRSTLPPEVFSCIRGFFTDEPQLARKGIPWSPVLPEEYRRRYGRDLLEELPALVFGMPNADAVRVRFWRLVAILFRDSYIRQVASWCHAHRCLLTGHHLADENFLDQTFCNGSIMAQYPEYDIPGADHLCRIPPDPVMMIQLASAAMQSGKRKILTESFGLTGWNLNFRGMKWIYQQQMVCGINLLCQHLESYSLKGVRKRDYPGSSFVHQPWWDDCKAVNDTFARMGILLSAGKPLLHALVLHPLSTGWKVYDGKPENRRRDYYNRETDRLTRELLARNISFHYADEILFEEMGSEENGRIRIGACSYPLVVIPPVSNLSSQILAALQAFRAHGGTIAVMRNMEEPSCLTVDGESASEEVRNWFAELPAFDSASAVADAVAARTPDRVITLEHGVPTRMLQSTCRLFDDRRCWYIVNTSDSSECEAEISLPDTGRAVELYRPETNVFLQIEDIRHEDGRIRFSYRFAPAEAAVFFVSDAPCATETMRTLEAKTPAVMRLDGVFRVRRHSGNLLTLDRCSYQIDGGPWVSDDVSVIHGRLLKAGRDCTLRMRFDIEADASFDSPVQLVMEEPGRFDVTLNGRRVERAVVGFLFDHAFKRIELKGGLRKGRNLLELETRFHEEAETYECLEKAKHCETEYNKLSFISEIESIYLLGDFSVRHAGLREKLDRDSHRLHGDFILGAPLTDTQIDASNILFEGFPFFAGKITLAREFTLTADQAESIRMMRLKPTGANSCLAVVNGRKAAFLHDGKWLAPVRGLLKEGTNTLEIEMTTSLRNLLGPHHLEEGESYRVTPLSFNREANAVGWPTPPCNPGYCFVDVGISKLEFL